MIKSILTITLIAVISSVGLASGAFPALKVYDDYALFGVKAENLIFTCPDGTQYNNANLTLSDYSRQLTENGHTTGRIDSTENSRISLTLSNGYTDGIVFVSVGHINHDQGAACANDRVYDSSFTIIGYCNHSGPSDEQVFTFIDHSGKGHSLEFVKDTSELHTNCDIPFELIEFPPPICQAGQIVDKKTNTCVIPPELKVRGYDAKDSPIFNFDNKYSAPGTMGQDLNGVRTGERILVMIDNHIEDPLIEAVSLALNGRPYEYRPVDTIPSYNDEFVLPTGTFTIITSESKGTDNPRAIFAPDARQGILIDLAESFADRRTVELHVRTSTGEHDFTRQISIGSFVATPGAFP